jgi:hypothetical protein
MWDISHNKYYFESCVSVVLSGNFAVLSDTVVIIVLKYLKYET